MLNLKISNLFLKKTTSTQTFAKENFSKFDPNIITCVTAQKQTSGIGRFKRDWYSPKGNLYSTFYFTLPKKTKNISSLTLILAITFCEILKEFSVQIKWPNDILLFKKKVAGILCETFSKSNNFQIFLGIGINVNMTQKDLNILKTKNTKASSLKILTKKNWDIEKLLFDLQKEFLKNLKIFLKKGFLPFHKTFESLLAFKKKELTLFDGKDKYMGKIDSIKKDGALNFKLKNGKIKTFYSADILF
jgi:BirA family biotin operon repressor/biotin-[acetyl-CoA-carboxylase] ligase